MGKNEKFNDIFEEKEFSGNEKEVIADCCDGDEEELLSLNTKKEKDAGVEQSPDKKDQKGNDDGEIE